MASNGLYLISNARITFRNFRGEERQFNNAGDRNFNVVLTEEQCEECKYIGFNVRSRESRIEGGDTMYLLPVAVSYKHRPPKVVLIADGKSTLLDENTIGELDYADFANIDLSIRPYPWQMPNGSSGVKAYLNSGYFTLADDGFSEKYRNIPQFGDEDTLPF